MAAATPTPWSSIVWVWIPERTAPRREPLGLFAATASARPARAMTATSTPRMAKSAKTATRSGMTVAIRERARSRAARMASATTARHATASKAVGPIIYARAERSLPTTHSVRSKVEPKANATRAVALSRRAATAHRMTAKSAMTGTTTTTMAASVTASTHATSTAIAAATHVMVFPPATPRRAISALAARRWFAMTATTAQAIAATHSKRSAASS
jgi:hypothetical protein